MALGISQKNLDSFIASMCQKAEALGASEAVALSVDDIVVDERTGLKCFVPLCSSYGVNLMCPPNVPPISKFREVLSCYHSAILIKMVIPLSGVSGDSGEENEEPPGAPTAEEMSIIVDAQRRLHQIIDRIESLCFAAGYRFAAGLIGGACCLCEECVGLSSGLPCRHPFKARPSMDAVGIDVVATVQRVGLHLSFGPNDGRSWVGMVLVD
jgi:predicted metal-binding protein